MDKETVKKAIIEEAKKWADSSLHYWVFWALEDLAYSIDIGLLQSGDLEKLTKEEINNEK